MDRLADADPRRAYSPDVVVRTAPLVLPAASSPAAARNVAEILSRW